MEPNKPVYKRILLKISGEALAGDQEAAGLTLTSLSDVCAVIKQCLELR